LAVLVAAGVSFGGGVAAAWAGSLFGAWEWPPKPSGWFGVTLGFVAAGVVLFEMLIWPRKLFRGWRLGATRRWLQLHVWAGFASLPVVVLHAGFGFGGPLPAATLILFLAVYASGVWGLVLQQWLPQKMLADVPNETVAAEAGALGEGFATEAERLTQAGVADGADAGELAAFRDTLLVPYLRHGRRASPLGTQAESDRRFARLAESVPSAARPHVRRLRRLAEARRQLDRQRFLHGWLHGWLVVHLPLSVAMTGLMVLHAVRALKYW
jgi:hypothetical protein